jgi:hypothetical protein
MPEEKAGSSQKSIEAAISSMNAGQRNGTPVDQATVQQAAERRVSGQPIPKVTLPPFATGGKK